MGLSVGIVGLPNVGKSTLFNALLKKQQAYVANFPFATIEPNIGIVPVPDSRLEQLRKVVEGEILRYKDTKILGDKKALNIPISQYPNIPIIPATIEFVDIAGLIAGAHKGEGLGNKFLSHIREVDAVCHVVRAFSDPDVIKQGIADPKTDFDVVQTELKLADLETLEKQKDPGNTPNKELVKWWEVVKKLKEGLAKGISAKDVPLTEEETKLAKQLSLLTAKPILIAINVDEKELKDASALEEKYALEFEVAKNQVIAVCAKTESELAGLSEEDQIVYLNELGLSASGLERIIKKAFATLGLSTFLTAGEKEVRAWTIKNGMLAPEAAGVIHTDFEKKFIKADVVGFDDFVSANGWKNAREKGLVRSEGRDYIVKDGDVVEFKIGS